MQDQPVIDPNKKPPHGRNMAPPCPPKTHGSNRQRQGRSELPEGWRWVKLGDVCKIEAKLVDPKISEYGALPHVNGQNIASETCQIKYLNTAAQEGMTSNKYLFESGSVLYSKLRPYLRKAAFADFRGLCSADMYPLQVVQGAISPQYLTWLLVSDDFTSYADEESRRSRMPKLNRRQLFSWETPLPPLNEQKRIVAILSDRLAAVEQARLAAEAQLEAATALPAAYLRQVFDSPEAQKWEKKALGDVAKVGSGITLGRKFKEDVATRRVPYLRVANVKDGYLDLSDITATEATESEISKCLLQYGDILLTEGGDPDKLGRGTYWQNELMECIHQNHIFRVRFDLSDYVPSFISAQIGSSYGKSYFLSHAKQTTGIATINQRVLKGFPLASPPVEIQKEIVSRLENELRKAEEIKKLLQDQLDTINALPAALLRQAFNGEL